MKLGDRLREINERDDAERQRVLLEAQAKLNAQVASLHQSVRAFFAEARHLFEDNLTAGFAPGYVRLGGNRHRDTSSQLKAFAWRIPPAPKTWRDGQGIWTPGHPCYFIWQEFEAWCADNGLSPEWTYNWDGGGVESWFDLSVVPA